MQIFVLFLELCKGRKKLLSLKMGEMAEWLNRLSAKSEDLSLILWSLVAEGEKQLPKSAVCPLHMQHGTHAHINTHTYTEDI